MFRRLFCLFLACAVLFCLSVPAFATGVMPGGSGGSGVGIPVVGEIQLDVVDFGEYIDNRMTNVGNFFAHFVNEDICPNAPQLGGGHKFQPVRTLRDGQVGLYYQCEYCGQSYGEALEEAYQEYVQTLPSPQYNSSGAFLWRPGAADFVSGSLGVSVRTVYNPIYTYYMSDSGTLDLLSDFPSVELSASGNGSTIRATALARVGDIVDFAYSGSASYSDVSFTVSWGSVVAPINGTYTPVDSRIVLGGSFYGAGSTFAVGAQTVSLPAPKGKALQGSMDWLSFWVVPYVSGGGNTYELTTRVCGSADNNQGLYGYVEDGQLYQSTVGTIYNETSNVFQNPVTGDTSNVESWAYDYSDRSYTLTTNEGDEITVTYGDSSVVINEGGTTYNVYYLMEETEDIQQALESYCDHDYSSVLVTAPTCTASGVRTYTCSKCGAGYTQIVPPTGHDYQSAVTMAPTCVNTGVRTFTCSCCGDSYTVSIAATGHTWQVVSTTPTTYDSETGQLVQAGYTLYQCSTCGEQYKIEADSGGSSLPVPSSGGVSTDTGELLSVDGHVGKGFLATVAHGLTEDLPEAIRAASSWFTELPKLYEGYIGFLGASIAWLPSDIQALFRFSVGFVTFVGIIRKIWARG